MTVEQLEQLVVLRSARGHDETRDVVDGVPCRAPQRSTHRVRVGAVGHEAFDLAGQVGGGPSAVEHSDLVALLEQTVDEAATHEGASAEYE